MLRLSTFFILICFTALSEASVQVAFFEGYHHDGRRAELSPGDRFFHVAIQVEGLWYEASAPYGVQKIESLKKDKSLKLIEILSSPMIHLKFEQVRPYLGLPFDYQYKWFDKNSSYCSKLVANLLGVEPSPMDFSSEHWKLADKEKMFGLGISPDELYEALKARGFVPLNRSVNKALLCKRLL